MRKLFFLLTYLFFAQTLSAQCPFIFQLSNQDLEVCEMENFIFTAQFDDQDLATVNWTLPDGTVETTFALGQFFDSSTGCNEILEYGYEVLCEDSSVLESGTFTVTVYTFNEALVEVGEDCSYTVLPDCPDDVEIIINSELGDTYQAVPGTQGTVLVEISNVGAPDECKYNTFNYNFDCAEVDIETGIESSNEPNLAIAQGGGLIELKSDLEIEKVALYDLSGRPLWKEQSLAERNSDQIRIPSSLSGICILVLQTSNGIYAQKLYLQ